MENIRIKAAPEVLEAGAAEVRHTVSGIRQRFSNIETTVNRSSGYWQGDAAEAHRAVYREMKGTVDEIFVRLEEHAKDLQEMARVYLGTEERAAETAQGLPSDAIL